MHLTASFIGDDMKKLFFPANLWLQVSRWWQRLSATWNSRNRVSPQKVQPSQGAHAPQRSVFWTLKDIEGVVNTLYERRLNVLSGRTEYRRLDDSKDSPWKRVDKRFYHTLMTELQAHGMLYGCSMACNVLWKTSTSHPSIPSGITLSTCRHGTAQSACVP